MPGWVTEPPPFTGGLSFPETWRCFCCAGLELCAPDGGIAEGGGLFLLCWGSAAGGRWVLRVPIPAVPGWEPVALIPGLPVDGGVPVPAVPV